MQKLKIYLTGRITIETPDGIHSEQVLPGRQGRLAFVFLVLERDRPASRDELAEILWPSGLPQSWDASLSAVVSKIRSALDKTGAAADVESSSGCYRLRLPSDAWVDIERAFDAQHAADALFRSERVAEAYPQQGIAHAVARRPFLPGEEGPWVERTRTRLRDLLLQSLDLGAQLYLWMREPEVAIRVALEALEVDPFRERAYRSLMRAHADAGSRAEALRAYERCRRLLVEELGASPSEETQALYLELLKERRA